MLNCNNAANDSRGVVQSQFGFSLPALSICALLARSLSEASSISLSFNSKGLSLRNSFCSEREIFEGAIFSFMTVELNYLIFYFFFVQDIISTIINPEIIRRVLPTAYGTVYPRAGVLL